MAHKISFICCLIFFSSVAYSAKIEIEKTKSEVEFLAIGKPSMIKIRGKGAKPEGKLDLSIKGAGAIGEIKIDLNDFDTGIKLRNEHMKEKYLHTNEADKRYAVFKISKLGIKPENLLKDGKFEKVPVEGLLTLHGTEKPVSSEALVEVKGEDIEAATKINFKLSDYKIDIPSYLGVTVAEDVVVDVKLKGRLNRGAP